jgi:hypothetical protein
MCFETNIVSDDEDGDSDDEREQELDPREFRVEPVCTSFDLNGPSPEGADVPVIIEDEEDIHPTSDATLFLQYHQQFGHTPPTKIQLISKAGVIPKCLADCPILVCSSCLYGKATKCPWRGKMTKKKVSGVLPITRSGQEVSVNQLISPMPGLIAHMAGS